MPTQLGMTQMTLGFSTARTHLRPPRGQTWVMMACNHVGAAGDLQITDGVNDETFRSGSQDAFNANIAMTHDWWLTAAGTSLTTGWVLSVDLGFGGSSYTQQLTDVTSIAATSMRALHTTEQTLIAAPGANRAIHVFDVRVYMNGTTAFGGIADTEDLTIRYEDGDGTVLATVETTGFLDQTTRPFVTVNADPGVALEANEPVVIANSGAITGGSQVIVTVAYEILDV